MPQSSDDMRKEFMTDTDDGIATAEARITNAGGTVNKGMIAYLGEDEEVIKAIQFLIDEWDYAVSFE